MAGQARGFITLAIVIAMVPLATALIPASPSATFAKHYMSTAPAGVLMARDIMGIAAPAAANDLVYHGGPILPSPKVYLVFWGWNLPQSDPDNVAPYLINFFTGVGGTGWANIQTQYDGAGAGQGFITNPTSQLGGVWYDNGPLPPDVPDEFMATEAARAAMHFGNQPNANYMINTPYLRGDANFETGVGGYCAWHSATTDGAGHTISFTNMPYVAEKGAGCGAHFVNSGAAGRLDGVSIVAGHEYEEAVTDPAINAWYAPSGGENADLCAWVSSGPGRIQNIHLSTGDFAVQGLWSNAVHGCAITGP